MRGQPVNKVELWMYLGTSFIPRGLTNLDTPGGVVDERYARRVDDMFGNRRWRVILDGRQRGLLDPEGFRQELVNEMRWQLHEQLGYKTTLPLEVPNPRGGPLYTMIFATDHPVGERIMAHILDSTDRAFTDMRLGARAKRINDAAEGLFDVTPSMLSQDRGLNYFTLGPPQPPWVPPRD